MLMSIRMTSGLSRTAISIASRPDAAEPTTSMSLSKPRSFVRWSRVSGMSSTTRTRIWSAISLRLILDAWAVRWVGSAGNRDGRRTRVRCARRPRVLVPRRRQPSGGLGPLAGRRRDGLDDLGWQDAVVVDEHLESDTSGLSIDRRKWSAGDRIDEVTNRSKGERHVLYRPRGTVHLRELQHFGLLCGDGKDDDLRLVVQRRRTTCRR